MGHRAESWKWSSRQYPEPEQGGSGLHRRLQGALHLLTNTRQLGVVPRGVYMPLLRSVLAAAGSFGSLYEGTCRLTMATDMLIFFGRFPLRMLQDQARVGWRHTRWQAVSLPNAMKLVEPPVITEVTLDSEPEPEFPFLPRSIA